MAGFVGYTQLLLSKVSVQAPDMQQAIQLLSRGNPGRPIFFSVLSSFFCLLSMLLMVLNFLKPSEMFSFAACGRYSRSTPGVAECLMRIKDHRVKMRLGGLSLMFHSTCRVFRHKSTVVQEIDGQTQVELATWSSFCLRLDLSSIGPLPRQCRLSESQTQISLAII